MYIYIYIYIFVQNIIWLAEAARTKPTKGHSGLSYKSPQSHLPNLNA